ncbi:glycosyl transferase family 2 [Flavobacteriaceae bacterium MAR_2010_72]|nr:glycosyl transferase family 2 [Flavobacteriaceae bacterium MAR_2010_72]TVZ59002.1 glycosyl transferase family 2 [Flavobacteriaceae bacterium MAR_2010_105]
MTKENFNKKVPFEILISTMRRTNMSFLHSMFPHKSFGDFNILIINQTLKGQELISDQFNIRVINTYSNGLSLSRNMAIENAIGDICLIADDDVQYIPNFEDSIRKAFTEFTEASVICFEIETYSGEPYKHYPLQSKPLFGRKDIKSVSSIEIAFKRKLIVSNKIKFNLLFGLGSHFPSGEEYLFLKDVLKHKLKVYFKNQAIVKHSFERSTSNMASDDFIRTAAVLYYIDYRKLAPFIFLKFVLFLMRKGLISILDGIKVYKKGLQGMSRYKKIAYA